LRIAIGRDNVRQTVAINVGDFHGTGSPRISNGVSAWKPVDVPRTTCKKPLDVAVGSPV